MADGETGQVQETDGWTPVEQAYSAWLAGAREKAGGALSLARRIARHLMQAEMPESLPERWASGLTSEADQKWARKTIGRWESGAGAGKRQPQVPGDGPVRDALVETVHALVPRPPAPTEWVTFRDVVEAFDADRLQRQGRGRDTEKTHAALERDERRHQLLAAWPSQAKNLDPLTLGLGSWAFNGDLPPYVPRTADRELAVSLQNPGITVVAGAPKSGKSRSILQVLQETHPEALTWWVNPTPTILSSVTDAAKKTQTGDAAAAERPGIIVLDDAGLIGTDPTTGITAQRLTTLAATGAHVLVVLHDQTLADWEHQLTHRAPGDLASASSLGVTQELMDLFRHRVHYDSVLDDTETITAASSYDAADERVRSFDLTRLAETLAGVDMLRSKAHRILTDPASMEAALLEAAIDATITFPTGATPDILQAFAQTHWRRRQPNRLWRRPRFEAAFDILTTGIGEGSPHAILTTTDHTTYRLLDALTPELQQPSRDILSTIADEGLKDLELFEALLNAGLWHHAGGRKEVAKRAWTQASTDHEAGWVIFQLLGELADEMGDPAEARLWWERGAKDVVASMHSLGILSDEEGDAAAARMWWERAAAHGYSPSLIGLGVLARREGRIEEARIWYTAAAEQEEADAMSKLGYLAEEEEDPATARMWWERAAKAGEPNAMFKLGDLAKDEGDRETARMWWERAAEQGHGLSMHYLGRLAKDEGDRETARMWWERAAGCGLAFSGAALGFLADAEGDRATARKWLEQAAADSDISAMIQLGAFAREVGDVEGARIWWEKAAENGEDSALHWLGVLAWEAEDWQEASDWWKRAAKSGSDDAMFNLALLSSKTGKPVAAALWLKLATDSGNAEALKMTEMMAESGSQPIETSEWPNLLTLYIEEQAEASEERGEPDRSDDPAAPGDENL